MLNATPPPLLGVTPRRNSYARTPNVQVQIPPPAGRGKGEGSHGRPGAKNMGSPKMTDRTQFSPALAAISACAAQEWRSPSRFRTCPKIEFALGSVRVPLPRRLGNRGLTSMSLPRTRESRKGLGHRSGRANHAKQKNERTNPIPGNSINGIMLQ